MFQVKIRAWESDHEEEEAPSTDENDEEDEETKEIRLAKEAAASKFYFFLSI